MKRYKCNTQKIFIGLNLICFLANSRLHFSLVFQFTLVLHLQKHLYSIHITNIYCYVSKKYIQKSLIFEKKIWGGGGIQEKIYSTSMLETAFRNRFFCSYLNLSMHLLVLSQPNSCTTYIVMMQKKILKHVQVIVLLCDKSRISMIIWPVFLQQYNSVLQFIDRGNNLYNKKNAF